MSKKLWGGRFSKSIDRDFEEFSKSIHYDYKLAEYDIYHSLIHVAALAEEKLISAGDKKKLVLALESILKEIKSGRFKFNLSSEDIHTDIQNKVEKKAGKSALKLHTFRSRNEQIAFDEKFYCIKEAEKIYLSVKEIITSLNYLSRKYKSVFIPGYTHTQRAQVVKLSDYLGAYTEMFARDTDKLNYFIKNTSVYVKSGALAGSPLSKVSYQKAIEAFKRKYSIKGLRIEVSVNTLDNVSSRDFIIDFLSIISVIQMHLSRMAEDFILYSTAEFGFFNLPEEFCTGSSLMPHKKNPDFLELTRGYTGRVYGYFVSLLVMMKGLPLTYNRDMQLDKEPLFSALCIVKDELKITAKFIKGIKLNYPAIERALEAENLYATELAGFLVYKGVPFREAHNIVGRIIKYCEGKGMHLKDIEEKTLKSFHSSLTLKAIEKITSYVHSVNVRK